MDDPPVVDRVKVSQRKGVLIEYPGHILEPTNAIITLGGPDALSAALEQRQQVLKLRLRPDDPLSHPIYGERQPCAALLLRISRPAAQPEADPTVSIAARLDATYTFQGLADYQYLPIDPQLESRSYSLLPGLNQPTTAEPFRTPQPLLIVPPLFSRNDVPVAFAFKDVSEKQRQEVARAVAAQRSMPWTTSELPPELAVPPSVNPAVAAALQQLLQRHPVWLLPSLEEALQQHLAQQQLQKRVTDATAEAATAMDVDAPPTDTAAAAAAEGDGAQQQGAPAAQQHPSLYSEADLQAVLHATCYQFKTGPWRGCYIRCGFDPRKDVSGRSYQVVLHRTPSDWHAYVRARRAAGDPLPQPSPSALHRFEALPLAYTSVFQVGSLEDPQVQQLLQAAPWPPSCSEHNGWFTYSSLQQIQQAINQRVSQVLAPQLAEVQAYVEQQRDAGAAGGGGGVAGGVGGTQGSRRLRGLAPGAAAGAAAAAGAEGRRGAAGGLLPGAAGGRAGDSGNAAAHLVTDLLQQMELHGGAGELQSWLSEMQQRPSSAAGMRLAGDGEEEEEEEDGVGGRSRSPYPEGDEEGEGYTSAGVTSDAASSGWSSAGGEHEEGDSEEEGLGDY